MLAAEAYLQFASPFNSIPSCLLWGCLFAHLLESPSRRTTSNDLCRHIANHMVLYGGMANCLPQLADV